MKEFNAKEVRIETASALETVKPARADRKYPAYIGLDVHKETIAVAVAQAGREAPESRGEIANKPKTVAKLAAILNLGGLLNGRAPHREDLPGTTMIPKRPAAKFDPADLAV